MYSQSSCKRPPWEFTKVVATRAGCLREWAHGKTIEGGPLPKILEQNLAKC